MYLADLQEKYHDYLYEKNLVRSVLAWATKQNLPNSVIHFELHTKQESYTRTIQGWSKNRPSQEASILVYRLGNTATEKRLSLLTREKIILFRSADIQIVEILNEDSPRLLRHGITPEEKDLLLIFSRALTESKLLHKQLPIEINELIAKNPRFKQVADVDVVMWVNGTMRGSIIKTGLPLIDAIQESCIASLSDSRFKPIQSEELTELTLEINILSDLHIPLPSRLKQTQPEEQKGYFVTYKNKTGWYLPGVFNSQKYHDLPHLLNELATKKASISHLDVPHARFYHFEVTTFAEIPHDSSTTSARDKINAAADWMLSIQDKKGFIPTIVSPYDSTSHKADWVRMALAALALNEYGVTQRKEAYTKAARLTFDYIVSTIDGLAILSHPNYILCVIYLCRMAIANNDLTKASELFQKIESKLRSTQLSTIAQLQLASLYTEMTALDKKYRALAIDIIETEYRIWESVTTQNKSETSYAEYAELIPLLYNLSSTNADYVPIYQKIMSWYIEAQQTNGAFPNTQRSSYCYTRGTGKIFEAMSIDEKNIDSVHNSLSWTLSLQYTHKNLFYIPPSERQYFSGSIMHDSFDHSAWTDSVSHLLIGAARLHKISPDLLN